VWLSVFYAPFVPIVVPISIAGLFLFYLCESYLFRTSYNVPHMLSKHISNTAIAILNYLVFIISAGQALLIIYIELTLRSYLDAAEIVAIVLAFALSLIFFFIPGKAINKKIWKFEETHNELSYDEAL